MKKIVLYISLATALVSCELTDAINQDPPNNLVPSNVVQNEEDAQALLNGVYGQIVSFSSSHYYMYSETIPSAMIGTMASAGFGTADSQFAENDFMVDNSTVNNFWKRIYSVIDAANNSITLTADLPSSEISSTTRQQIIGEAHFLRAMATFDVLRYFGQFYDSESQYGIVLRTEPVNFVTRDKARSSVSESYNQILTDLDFAIENAPDFSVNYKASKTAAMALKARVLLYKGDYAEAAALADEVINKGTRSLEEDFESVFSEGLNSTELILQTYRDANSDIDQNNRKRFYLGRAGSTYFPELMEGDPRQPFTYSGTSVLKVNNPDTYRPTYFIRLAEMYFIKAEGLARSGASVTESKEPLDAIRIRAGLAPSAATTNQEVLDDIFNEIFKELAFENGSDWFAAIRFDKAMTLKPSLTDVDNYILPIPLEEIEGNALIGYEDQNPGYDL